MLSLNSFVRSSQLLSKFPGTITVWNTHCLLWTLWLRTCRDRRFIWKITHKSGRSLTPTVLFYIPCWLFRLLAFESSKWHCLHNSVGRSGQSNVESIYTLWLFPPLRRLGILRKLCLSQSHNHLNWLLSVVFGENVNCVETSQKNGVMFPEFCWRSRNLK